MTEDEFNELLVKIRCEAVDAANIASGDAGEAYSMSDAIQILSECIDMLATAIEKSRE